MGKTAILVDGGFYKKRAKYLWGTKSGEERAKELVHYCFAHLKDRKSNDPRDLYRIFYYDCNPVRGVNIYHPLLKRNIKLGETDSYDWMTDFIKMLMHQRKFALRLGNLSSSFANYNLKPEATKDLLAEKRSISDLTEGDFALSGLKQQGIDMRIGVDISSMVFKKQVEQIVLIAGDSDFVPAAKLARREGVDFMLDPMWQNIDDSLNEHIDGLRSPWKKSTKGKSAPTK